MGKDARCAITVGAAGSYCRSAEFPTARTRYLAASLLAEVVQLTHLCVDRSAYYKYDTAPLIVFELRL